MAASAIRDTAELSSIGAMPWQAGTGTTRASATNSSNQALTDDAANVITNWTAESDDGALNPVTGVYTVPATNAYNVSAQCGFDNGGTTVPGSTGCSVDIQRSSDHGATWASIAHGQFVYTANSNSPAFPNVTRFAVPLNKGDLLRVTATPSSGGAVTTWALFPVDVINLFSVTLAAA